MTDQLTSPPILLVAGHWLGAWAWDDVLAHLSPDARVTAVTLPGLDAGDPERATRTLDDQALAIRDALESLGASTDGPAIVVAHSGANGPVSIVLDRHPELVRRVIWVDSGPMASGSAFAPELPDTVAELPLPPFDVLSQQASLDGVDAEHLDRFRARAVPQPAPVLREQVVLTDDARHAVPTTLVCCSISGEQVMAMARGGHPMFAEVSRLQQVDVVDLPTGHWPMWSTARELAEVIETEAARAH
ncbi:alpha/beta fold hydrolase [Microbacterium sp. AG238]|jgi:pimeloyl-ACP methyl ester carboxylesterase|uniref:alpha/beta fold hydrolase n=1 Tax=Microbacterium sp. AG238 TaxID=2183994 RepID=UPI000E70A15E|nr:alpha/beta hydrolase [Microbacterium sp. AG238]RKE64617.1 alpha/beta hydrolase family protein [Microbacterium sp. AG238]